jgi:hypothetical protein
MGQWNTVAVDLDMRKDLRSGGPKRSGSLTGQTLRYRNRQFNLASGRQSHELRIHG